MKNISQEHPFCCFMGAGGVWVVSQLGSLVHLMPLLAGTECPHDIDIAHWEQAQEQISVNLCSVQVFSCKRANVRAATARFHMH